MKKILVLTCFILSLIMVYAAHMASSVNGAYPVMYLCLFCALGVALVAGLLNRTYDTFAFDVESRKEIAQSKDKWLGGGM